MLTNAEDSPDLRFEYTLAFHCAPAMAGIKPADLISWPQGAEECRDLLERYARGLSSGGIRLRLLHGCRNRCLILVYREDRLSAQLERREVRELLRRDGYPVERGPEAMLGHLSSLLDCPAQFPHEVGLFLGYPAEDVEGFRHNGGRNCKLSGLWKVYSDVERARACFSRYERCRRGLCRRVRSGCRLCRLFGRGAA